MLCGVHKHALQKWLRLPHPFDRHAKMSGRALLYRCVIEHLECLVGHNRAVVLHLLPFDAGGAGHVRHIRTGAPTALEKHLGGRVELRHGHFDMGHRVLMHTQRIKRTRRVLQNRRIAPTVVARERQFVHMRCTVPGTA